ncbi:hypothetical protein Q5752_006552 [Cryptotrichosporon argae]
MDMDIDVGWCLTCSKKTTDTRNPYCSDSCRAQDSSFKPVAHTPVAITSPLPPAFLPPLSPPSGNPTPRANNTPSEKRFHRPPLAALAAPPPPASTSGGAMPIGRSRDRRAFSFPTQPPPMLDLGAKRNSITAMPRFARRTNPVAFDASARPLPQRKGRLSAGFALSTGGANTPNIFESAVTSDSSDLEPGRASPVKKSQPLAAYMCRRTSGGTTGGLQIQLGEPSSVSRSSLHASSFASHLPTVRPTESRKPSQSPVATLIATSASSRSREDIISWARAVGARPREAALTDESGDDETDCRGRSRTRRDSALATTTTTTPVREEDDVVCAGTTPRGARSLGLLTMSTGLGLVRASKGVAEDKALVGPSTAIALPATPAPAEVSLVDVLATPACETEPSLPSIINGGATPTLSTMSISEAFDPSSITDIGDHVEVVTDDQSAFSSNGFYHSMGSAKKATPVPPVLSVPQAQASPELKPTGPSRRKSLPLRPIVSTASAIWSLSSYLRNLAPFTAPFSMVQPASASSQHPPPPSISTPHLPAYMPTAGPPKAHAVAAPAIRSRQLSPADTTPLEVVRSLPMDILASPTADPTERMRELREREVEAAVSRVGSRSRTRIEASRTPSLSRSRSRRRPESRGRARGMSGSPACSRDRRQGSYDADAEDDEEGRGRSRRGKVVSASKVERGRRPVSSGDRSASARRGRSMRARPPLVA